MEMFSKSEPCIEFLLQKCVFISATFLATCDFYFYMIFCFTWNSNEEFSEYFWFVD